MRRLLAVSLGLFALATTPLLSAVQTEEKTDCVTVVFLSKSPGLLRRDFRPGGRFDVPIRYELFLGQTLFKDGHRAISDERLADDLRKHGAAGDAMKLQLAVDGGVDLESIVRAVTRIETVFEEQRMSDETLRIEIYRRSTP